MRACNVDLELLRRNLVEYIDTELDNLVGDGEDDSKPTAGFQRVIQRAVIHVQSSGREEVTGANVLVAIFAERERQGGQPVRVKRITTADYPTPARRPANSRLDCGKLALAHGARLPDWQGSLRACVARLLKDQGKDQQR